MITCYAPGAKANAEYEAFTGKRSRITPWPRSPPTASTDHEARKLLARTAPDQFVMDQIEYYDFLTHKDPRKFGTAFWCT